MNKSFSKLSFILALTLLLFLGVTGTSFASYLIKWAQPVWMFQGGDDIDSYDSPATGVQAAADDWQCTNGVQNITDINWWGSYKTVGGYHDTDSLFNTVINSFTINFYSNGATQPGSTVYSLGTYTVDDINESYFGGNMGTGDSVFRYHVTLDTPFDQTDGVTYWLSIYATINTGQPYTWAWCTADPDYNWGDPAVTSIDLFENCEPQYYPTGHYYDGEAVNLAFDLATTDGGEVPEPGTMMLLGSLATGLFGVAGMKRKFSRK
ncbi:MAG: PEP-CTERM sorting domain-containing protein [Candidatus Omnitrophica bacterium]|nr:PEP-CTERM sorting domain-containing protein [Candidatus Omnitrophota bacterium]